MQNSPIDNVISKVIAKILKDKDVETVSVSVLNCISYLIKDYVIEIGKMARAKANLENRANVLIQHIIACVNEECPIPTLYSYYETEKNSEVSQYILPNSSYQNYLVQENRVSNGKLPGFFPPIPDPHIAKNTKILAVGREQNKAQNRKRLLEERRQVKKSICLMKDESSVLWETQGQQEKKDQLEEVEGKQPTPKLSVIPIRSALPAMPKQKPIAEENLKGIYSDLSKPIEYPDCFTHLKQTITTIN